MRVVVLTVAIFVGLTHMTDIPQSIGDYYIFPNEKYSSCNSSHQNLTCISLQQLANNILNHSSEYLEKNITLIIEPGRHYIEGGVELNNTASIVIIGRPENGKRPEISCREQSCFSFRNASTILIENLIFSECFSEGFDGGALFISEAETVTIRQCFFVNNFVRRRGGAMRLQLINNVQVLASHFVNNSAICQSSHLIFGVICSTACTASSGAISASNISLFAIENSLFDGNVASCDSGTVGVTYSNITVINTKFIRNSIAFVPGSGGSLSLLFCIANLLECTFQENHVNGILNNGGGIYTLLSTINISRSYFTQNTAEFSGAAAYFDRTSLYIGTSIFSANTAKEQGGGIAVVVNDQHEYSVTIFNSTFKNNTVQSRYSGSGGAVNLLLNGKPDCTVSCVNNNVTNTHLKSVISIINSFFERNIGGTRGGAIFVQKGKLNISQCEFIRNTAILGGAVHSSENIVHLFESMFVSNIANKVSGGALNLIDGRVYSVNNTYQSNKGPSAGGAILAINSTVFSQADQYIGNKVNIKGGAVSTLLGDTVCSQCFFVNNSAGYSGGAVHVWQGRYKSEYSSYKANYASQNGGALFVLRSNAKINGDHFDNNVANYGDGAAIFQTDDTIELFNTAFTQNQVFDYDQKYTIQLTNVHGNCHNLILTDNLGSINLFYSTLNFSGSIYLGKNIGTAGGALTIIQSIATFDNNSEVSIFDNTATYGGGIFISQSELRVYTSSIRIENNTATISGGGMYGYQSRIGIHANKSTDLDSESILFVKNVAVENGGGVIAIATTLNIFHGFILFASNRAVKGGGIFLSEGSKINIQKTEQEHFSTLNVKTAISNNSAVYGGGMYVDDDTNSATLCQQSTRNSVKQISNDECFIQTVRLYYPQKFFYSQYNYINVFFGSNYASISGNDVFGGLLDRCQMNAFSEIRQNFIFADDYTGFDYLKLIAQFQILNVNYSQLTQHFDPRRIINTINKTHVKGLISSSAVQVCFCMNNIYNCSYQWPRVFAKHGESFSVNAITVNQVQNPVNGTVSVYIGSDASRLKSTQRQQNTKGICTELVYNVFSTEANATLILYPEGPCNDKGISSKYLSVTFLPCDCPNGLQPASLDYECKCVCDSSLKPFLRSCQINNGIITVVKQNNRMWIQYLDNVSIAGFLIHNCPYDYCIDNPDYLLSISLPQNVDKQCAYNRSGILCGECEEGLSLVFGSSRCIQCSNKSLALLIVFALAGIALVAFILILNMTVAVGTIHGLILYANIVGANSSVLLPPITVLRFFVSWVNLDFGIETCFFGGLDSTAKVWLQLVFPSYIILLSLLIIIMSTCWARFSRLIGRRNPVATLCTLFLLSYSKLLRTVIVILQFTHLTFPDGSNRILWLYDPNITYFILQRIPFFIIAIVITFLGSIYTLLLLFDQCIKKISGKCAQSSQYNAFIDAHHAPFVFKHRYWIGALLLIRIIHHCLSAILSESTHLLIVSSLMCAVLTFKLFTRQLYKNWVIGFLESSYFINLLLFAVSTFYVSTTNLNRGQVALANISIAIALFTFIGIVLFHSYQYCLNSFNSCNKVITIFKNTKHSRRAFHNQVSSKDEISDLEPSTLSMSLLREPALDDLVPISQQDYNPPNISTSESQLVTSTTVSIERE